MVRGSHPTAETAGRRRTDGTAKISVGPGGQDLAGYRVNLDLNKRVVTIDFRLSPDSKRQFVSLSMCEQFTLFGSLRKTLTDNPQLKIKDVRFTNQGQEIRL